MSEHTTRVLADPLDPFAVVVVVELSSLEHAASPRPMTATAPIAANLMVVLEDIVVITSSGFEVSSRIVVPRRRSHVDTGTGTGR